MKKINLLVILIVTITAQSSFAVCGVYIKNQAKVSNLIGLNELESALEKRGYYMRPEGFEDIELELDVHLRKIQVCYGNKDSILRDSMILVNELLDPPSSVEIKAYDSKTNEVSTYEKKLKLYNGNGTQVRRAIRKLIRDIPVCKTNL